MNQNDRNPDYFDPWDKGVYQTGSVEPPKKKSALVAFLLIVLVLMLGVITILGALNIKLFKQLDTSNNTPSLSILPADNVVTTPVTPAQPAEREDVSIQLQDQPEAQEDTSPQEGLSLQEIYTRCIDSVVSIICQNGNSSSTGTGVVLSENGYIVTNCHVVEDAKQIVVQLGDERQLPATLVGLDATSDLAVLRVDADDLTAAEFCDSDSLQVGDSVCAIGDPLGVELRGTMTDGIISAINRDITTGGRTMTLIQTNAALNSGNSGGPLINRFGQVVGINTMKIGDSMSVAGVEGLGFAIPSTTVKTVVDQLISQGYVSGRPHLGIQGDSVSMLYQYYYRLPEGLFLTEVEAGSNAEAMGLCQGDILLTLDGVKITGPEDLTTALYDYQVGDVIQAVIFRNNRQHSVELTVEEAKG